MTTRDEIEERLRTEVAVSPSEDGLRWLDERVARAMAPPMIAQRGPRTLRMLLRPLALVAAFVVLTGAVAGALGLLDRTIESSGSLGWRTAWDRAERLDLHQTDAGVTITLERAYADLNQVLVGFTVQGLEAPASSGVDAAPIEWRAELRDPSGRTAEQWATMMTGMGIDETGLSAVVQTWEGAPASMAGEWELTFTSVGYNSGGMVPGECAVGATDPACVSPPAEAMVEGSWRFAFELPALAGTVVSVDATATAGNATLHLTELRIAPTMISARINLIVGGSPVPWAFIPSDDDLRHGGTSYGFWSGSRARGEGAGVGTEMEFYTNAGADDAAGTWEIEIPELDSIGDGGEVHIVGPWKLTVTVP